MNEWKRFGDPNKMELGIRWVDDPEPHDRRPAEYGWSMGHLTIYVAGMNLTATMLDGKQQSYVHWYLAPFLDWLATNWEALLHEERLPWPDVGGEPAALACNHALEKWMAADDPHGQRCFDDAQDWYFRHGVRNAAAGGVFPDLFIRRIADDIELSWSGLLMPFTRDGLVFESGADSVRLSVGDVAKAIWKTLDWAVNHTPVSPAQYDDQIAALRTKVQSLRGVAATTCSSAVVYG